MRTILLACLVVAACGGDDTGGGPVPLDSLADELHQTLCDAYVACGLIEDHATCAKIDFNLEIGADLRGAIEAGTIVYHPDKARECLNATAATTGCNQNRV